MTTVALPPPAKQQFFSTPGVPLAGGKLFTYAAGTTTKQATYTDFTAVTPNANPIILNARGEPPVGMWLDTSKSYKLVLAPSTDTDPPAAPIWTVDNVSTGAQISDYVTPEQFGATGSGNDGPAIRAAVAYANANAIPTVQFTKASYDIWCSAKTTNQYSNSIDGHCIGVVANVELCGIPGTGTTLRCLSNTGAANTAAPTQTTTDAVPWRGGGIKVVASSSMDHIVLRDLVLDGTAATFVPGGGVTADLTHKGFIVQDTTCTKVIAENYKMRNFLGETFYLAGTTGISEVHVNNVELSSSPQSLWNPGVFAAVYANQLRTYNGKTEILIGTVGHWYTDCTFESSVAGLTSTTNPSNGVGGYPYNFPFAGGRDVTKPIPMIHFTRTRFIRQNLLTSGFVRGDLEMVDCSLLVGDTGFTIRSQEIDLDVTHITDQTTGSSAITIYGPANLVTQVVGAPVGQYHQPLQTCNIRLNQKRTVDAVSNSRTNTGLDISGDQLYDIPSCRFSIEGETRQAFRLIGSVTPGFKTPLIAFDTAKIIALAQPFGGISVAPTVGGTTTVNFTAVATVLNPASNGTSAIVLGLDVVPPVGQEWIIVQGDNTFARPCTIAYSGTGLQSRGDRKLSGKYELVKVRYSDQNGGSWLEVENTVREKKVINGAASIAVVALLTATQVTQGTVTVTGAVVGDFVTSVSASVTAAGVRLWGDVTSANTVTVYARNDSGSTWNPGTITFNARVEKPV